MAAEDSNISCVVQGSRTVLLNAKRREGGKALDIYPIFACNVKVATVLYLSVVEGKDMYIIVTGIEKETGRRGEQQYCFEGIRYPNMNAYVVEDGDSEFEMESEDSRLEIVDEYESGSEAEEGGMF